MSNCGKPSSEFIELFLASITKSQKAISLAVGCSLLTAKISNLPVILLSLSSTTILAMSSSRLILIGEP